MGEVAIVEGKTRLREHSARGGARPDIQPEQIETFFATLAETCNVVRSAKAAGFSANWAYRKRKFDAAFRNGWAVAVREGYSRLEPVLLERAIKGTPKLVRTARGTDRVMRDYSTALAVALHGRARVREDQGRRRMASQAVDDRQAADKPPESPVVGACYRVGTVSTGSWADYEGRWHASLTREGSS